MENSRIPAEVEANRIVAEQDSPSYDLSGKRS